MGQTFYGKPTGVMTTDCSCLTGTAFKDGDGNCLCKDNNNTIIGVGDLPTLGIGQMHRNPLTGGVRAGGGLGVRQNIFGLSGNPCAGKQAPSGYKWVYTNDAGCILVNMVTGQATQTAPANTTTNAVVNAGSSVINTGAGLTTTISNFVAQNQTLVLIAAAFAAWELFKKHR